MIETVKSKQQVMCPFSPSVKPCEAQQAHFAQVSNLGTIGIDPSLCNRTIWVCTPSKAWTIVKILKVTLVVKCFLF